MLVGAASANVAFVINLFSRRIVGWRVSSSMHTDFVLDVERIVVNSLYLPTQFSSSHS